MSTPEKFVLSVKPTTPGSSRRRLSKPNNTAEAQVARKKSNQKKSNYIKLFYGAEKTNLMDILPLNRGFSHL